MGMSVKTVAWSLLLLVPVVAEDQLARYRNLGKAFYENPTTQLQAVEEFSKALQLQPKSARERLNYGLALLRAGKTPEALAELERVQKQDPAIPHTWFNLGIQYKRQGDAEPAIRQFEQMIRLVPGDAISQYNLGSAYKLAGRTADAVRHFEIAAKLDPTLAGPHFQLFNAYRVLSRQADATRELQTFQKLKKAQEGAAIPEDMEWSMYSEVYDIVEPDPAPSPSIKYTTRIIPGTVDAKTSGMVAIDFNSDGKPDLLVWSSQGFSLYRSGLTPEADAFPPGPVLDAAPGDFDNDGASDLAAVTPEGLALYRNVNGRFVKQDVAVPPGNYRKAVWLDYDHDYDLDLLLLGKDSKLLRNQGAAGFADRTADFPFISVEAIDAVAFRLVPDTKGMDLAVSYVGRRSVLYRDKLAGVYEVEDFDQVPQGASGLLVTDRNHDGVFEVIARPGLASIDADFDSDGGLDTIEVLTDGKLQRRDSRASGNSWMEIALQGVKSLKLAKYAEVEIKAGSYYEKQLYQEVPLVFQLRGHTQADTVRITWPHGLIQNEIKQAAGKAWAYKEAQRLSGSCPMIWTWNGTEYTFVTDVLGVAPLGASAGGGKFFPVDRDEYIQIPRGALVAHDNVYDIRITEELSEVAFLDKVSLVAVDHPANIEIFTNDKFKGPPFPEFRLFGVDHKKPPLSAKQNGADVRPNILHRDRVYADRFRRDMNGVAERSTLDLDFGSEAARDNKSVLILNGWVDWADGSTFLAQSQEGSGGLSTPALQVRNEHGKWQTVIEDMGIPAGKPKTIVVDLTGKFLSPSREVRIVTNLAIYWEEIFLSENTAAPQTRLTSLAPQADLRFRGFSKAVIHPQRLQPETFLYPDPSPVSMWNQTPGSYTRYGSITDLLAEGDDRFVILGSGDEMLLRFAASGLPEIPDGWTRDFLLQVEGWAKDRDPNTAFSQTVEPLPFRSMSEYPYGKGESFPNTPAHQSWREQYNKRPALRPMQPLRPELSRRHGR